MGGEQGRLVVMRSGHRGRGSAGHEERDRSERWSRRGPVAVLAAVGVPLVEATSTPAGATATACGAATKMWTGGAGTANWDDANNWSPTGAPGSGSIACIPSTASVPQVNLSSSVTVQAVEADRPLNLSGTLSVSSTSITSSISSGTLTGTLEGAGATTISGSLTWGPNGAIRGIRHDDHRTGHDGDGNRRQWLYLG